MRIALASLIALGAVSTAIAQEQPAPAAPPAQAPAAEQPAPMAPMAPMAPPADPNAAPAQAAPVDPNAPPAAPVDPNAPPAAPAYVEPVRPPPSTDPTTLQVLSVLDKVCKPGVVGGDYDALAKAAGLKQKKKLWTLDLGKPYQVILENPGSNKNVCTLTVQYAQGDAQAQALATGLHDWATWENKPQLRLIRNDQTIGGDFKRFTVSWDDAWADGKAGLVYMRLKKLNDQSVGKNFEQAQVLYSTSSR
jgi:hypothetical protein